MSNDDVILDEKSVDANPVNQFRAWYDYMVANNVVDPNAMTLSTVNNEAHPSCRVMLLKDFSDKGFSFFTNYTSRKSGEIEQHNTVSLNFFWKEKWMQVRIEGPLEKLSGEESDRYFVTRPRESQVGAWASPQSTIIKDRSELDRMYAEAEASFKDKPVTRPPWWGGYLLVPDYFEFWVGRFGRLHDRVCYRKENNRWKINRLAP